MEINTPDKAAQKFRRKLFKWSILFIVLIMMLDAFRVSWIMEFEFPIVDSDDPKDIGIVEDWLRISFPEGSVLLKMLYGHAWESDPARAEILVSIPMNKLRQFKKALPKEYVLQNEVYDCAEEYIIEDTYDILRIYQVENGDWLIYLDKEEPSAQLCDLIAENVRENKYYHTPDDIEATSPNGQYTVRLGMIEFFLYAELRENLGKDTWRSTEILKAVYDEQPHKVEWLNNDSFMLGGHKKNLSEYTGALEDSPTIQELN